MSQIDTAHRMLWGFIEWLTGGHVSETPVSPSEITDTTNDPQRAQYHAAVMVALPLALAAAPAVYSAYLGKKKKVKESEIRTGMAIENASMASTTLFQTALASSVIAAAYTYILVQKLEDGKIISKGLGDAAQTILAVSAAGPAIQGITSVGSAFAKRGAK